MLCWTIHKHVHYAAQPTHTQHLSTDLLQSLKHVFNKTSAHL